MPGLNDPNAGTGNAMHDDHDHEDDHDHFHPSDAPSSSADSGIDEDILATHYHSKKDRVFVRGMVGEYNLDAELKRLRDMPRVRKAREIKFVDGPQAYSRHYIEPKDGITQTFHLHLEEYGPGGKSQKHGHVNEAAFYILDGAGYEIHDNQRYDWEAGDIAIVHNNCVHQHFNASETEPARALVIKTKPMFLFMNMLFQKTVEPRQTQAAPGGAGFRVREEEDDFNHPEEGY
jgi:mannose-6-phosphate isomerase-like protein (cupin superfamily)